MQGVGLHGVCTDPLFNILGYPHICETPAQCVAKASDESYIEGTCECGKNPTGLGHCRPFIGDDPGVDMIANLKLFIASGYWA